MTTRVDKPASLPRQQGCVRILPEPPPCQHGTIKKPCCGGCERTWYRVVMRQMDGQQRQQEREAGG